MISYNKLWKLLIDKRMNKGDLRKATQMSPNSLAKLGKNEDVRVGVLVKICETLNCKLDDIVDIV